jgi:hypothetical protein
MGTFAKTANVDDCRLSFANQGKQTSIFHFRLQQTNGRCHFPLVSYLNIYTENGTIYIIYCIYICTQIPINIHIHIHIHIRVQYIIHSYTYINIYAQAFFLNTFTVCSSSKWKFFICLYVDEEQTEVIRLQTD